MAGRRTLVFELLGYALFTAAMASLVLFVVNGAAPSSNRRAVRRPAADAKRLQAYLHIPAESPAVIEFMDFQCPPCRASWSFVKAALARHPEYRYYAVNFPLPMHPDAFPAAVASEIAKKAGVGRRVFDDLFSGGTELDTPSLNTYLKKQKLPPVIGSAKSDSYKRVVKGQMQFGKSFRIGGTPTIFVLGRDGALIEIPSATSLDKALN